MERPFNNGHLIVRSVALVTLAMGVGLAAACGVRTPTPNSERVLGSCGKDEIRPGQGGPLGEASLTESLLNKGRHIAYSRTYIPHRDQPQTGTFTLYIEPGVLGDEEFYFPLPKVTDGRASRMINPQIVATVNRVEGQSFRSMVALSDANSDSPYVQSSGEADAKLDPIECNRLDANFTDWTIDSISWNGIPQLVTNH